MVRFDCRRYINIRSFKKKKERYKGNGERFRRLPIKKNYWQQDITHREHAWNLAKALGITVVTAWLYYHSLWTAWLLFPLFFWHYFMMEEEYAKKKELDFQIQFKEAIQAVSSALNTGYSVENAFREGSQVDLAGDGKDFKRIDGHYQTVTDSGTDGADFRGIRTSCSDGGCPEFCNSIYGGEEERGQYDCDYTGYGETD